MNMIIFDGTSYFVDTQKNEDDDEVIAQYPDSDEGFEQAWEECDRLNEKA